MKTFIVTMLGLNLTSLALNLIAMALGGKAKERVNPFSVLLAITWAAWAAYLLIGGAQ